MDIIALYICALLVSVPIGLGVGIYVNILKQHRIKKEQFEEKVIHLRRI